MLHSTMDYLDIICDLNLYFLSVNNCRGAPSTETIETEEKTILITVVNTNKWKRIPGKTVQLLALEQSWKQ